MLANIFIALVWFVIKISLYILCASLRFTWAIIKWEGRAIKNSFNNYPIGFFSFFFHFMVFWIVFAWGEYSGNKFLCRLYTLGLCKDGEAWVEFMLKPLESVFLITDVGMESEIIYWVGMFAILFFLIPLMFIFCQTVVFLFPVLYSILTQIILGIPLRGLVLRWREKREEKEYKKYIKLEQKKILNNSSFHTSREERDEVEKERFEQNGMQLESYTFDTKQKTKYRDLDENYEKVKKKIDDRTFQLYHVHKQLNEKKGKNATIEKLYAHTVEVHNDMQEVYLEAVETICFTNNMSEINRCYADLKKELSIVRNAQISLTEEIKKVYGIQV